MRRTWTFTILKHEQPSDAAWQAILHFITEWNNAHVPKFTPVADFMWHVNFDTDMMDSMESLTSQLETLKQKAHITYHEASRSILEDDDYARADFIQIVGVHFDSLPNPFVLNMDEAILPATPCSECGYQDIFDSEQQAAFVIDENLLNSSIENESPEGEGGWDLIELPTGQTLVSNRVAEFLESNGVKGYKIVEVINGDTDRASERIFQLVATRSVLNPCMEHSRIKGEPFCPICGAAHGDLEEYFWIRKDWLSGNEIVSRHPNGSTMIYVSRRIYQLLIIQKFNGIHREDVMFCCKHDQV